MSDGGAVAYQVIGEGPDLIYVPNWISNIEVMWDEPTYARFLERLSSFARLICFDKRGSGVSESVPFQALPTLEQWMDDIRVVMDEVGTERAAVLAWDVGGLLSMLFAASYPDRVSHLVLVDTWAFLQREPGYEIGIPAHVLQAFPKTFEPIKGESDPSFYLAVVAPSAGKDPVFVDWYGRFMRLGATPTFARVMAETVFNWDLRPVLPSIQVPTLVMSHQIERYVRPDHGRYLAGNIPDARYVDLQGEDSLIFREDTDAILSEVRAFVTGVRESVDTDRVLATVLFTDIVGSTDRAVAVGDRRWSDLLNSHDAIVRTHIGEFRGREVKTTGDGFLATFDGPARAIRCATAIAPDIRGLDVDVKAGLHTGEIEVRGDDVGGIAVHTAARVMAAAGPGEVMVSRTVKDLVAGSGIDFEDRGDHELKGVPGEWRLYAVKS